MKHSCVLFIWPLLLASLFAYPISATAQPYWDPAGTEGAGSGGTGNWDNSSTNWFDGSSDVAWSSDEIATFGGTNGTVTLATGVTADGLTFTTPGYTIAGTNTLTLGGSAPAISVPIGSNTTISGIIGGTAGVTITGPGLVAFAGNHNTYTGSTILNGGIFSTGGEGVSNGAVANLGMTPTAFAANNIIFGGGTFYANNAIVLNTNRGITLATNATFDVTNAHTLTYGGIITGAYGLTKIDGGELALSGANTYTGSTTVSGGELVLSGGKNSYTGGTIINSGGIVSTGGEGASAGAVANLGKVPTSFISNNMVLNGGTFSANNSFTLHSNRGCLLTANSIIDVTTQQGSNQNLTVAGVIAQSGGAFGITKTSGGILKLSASNTYGGNTAISAGILVLTTNGSINNSPLISIAATSTFDVSSNASFVLSSNTTLSASGAGLTTNLGAAVLNGASSGTVNLGTQPISLTFTPTAFAGDSNHPSLYVSQGTLALNGNAFTVNNASGTALGAGNYILIQQASGSVSSSGSYTVNVTGSGLVSGNAASIQVSGGSVDLVVVTPVSTPPVFQAPTQSGGLFTLTWSTVSNQLYQIQSTASLTSPANWTNVGGAITATNTSMILSEPISANSQQFYRVLLLP